MTSSSHSHSHDHDPHDWASAEYVGRWAKGQDPKEASRQHVFSLIAHTIPCDKAQAITILDLGAGYGALTKFLLQVFPMPTQSVRTARRKWPSWAMSA